MSKLSGWIQDNSVRHGEHKANMVSGVGRLLALAGVFFVAATLLLTHTALASPFLSQSSAAMLPAGRAGLKGIASHWWYVERYGSPFIEQYARLGVTSVRLAVDWLHLEPVEGEPSFVRLDPIMAGFRERGIEVLPVVATVPPWAALNPGECWLKHLVCQLDSEKMPEFRQTMRQLVARYPEVRRWEFWNEPEMWDGLRDPVDYERWYRAFHESAKEANPSARIAVGTLSGWDFFSRLSPDLPLDAVSIHSYAGHRGDLLETDKILRLRDGLRGRGRELPIWLTEYGWDSKWMNDSARADAIRWVFTWLLDHPFVEVAHYHMLHDADEYWECCFGLVGRPPSYVPKQPAYDVFQSYRVAR